MFGLLLSVTGSLAWGCLEPKRARSDGGACVGGHQEQDKTQMSAMLETNRSSEFSSSMPRGQHLAPRANPAAPLFVPLIHCIADHVGRV